MVWPVVSEKMRNAMQFDARQNPGVVGVAAYQFGEERSV